MVDIKLRDCIDVYTVLDKGKGEVCPNTIHSLFLTLNVNFKLAKSILIPRCYKNEKPNTMLGFIGKM